jgi:hypothetical protein
MTLLDLFVILILQYVLKYVIVKVELPFESRIKGQKHVINELPHQATGIILQ